MSMWEPFSEPARLAIVGAQEAAMELGDRFIGDEHLLCGLAAGRSDPAAISLAEAGVTPDRLKNAIVTRRRQPAPSDSPATEFVFTPRAKRVIERAFEKARERNEQFIGAGHFLLGLIGDPNNSASTLLTQMGVDLELLAASTAAAMDVDAQSAPRPVIGATRAAETKAPGTWEHFSPAARASTAAAHAEAQRFGAMITAAHLLAGIVSDEDNAVAATLERHRVSHEKVRAVLESADATFHAQTEMTFAPEAKRVIDLAFGKAKSLKDGYIGTKHLLLGMIDDGTNSGTDALKALNVNIAQLRNDLLELNTGK
ncbi:MAG: hypothetical protein JO060_07810 [Candidatus Eremiobacteraeota bacterium]|nr:hypothetical protein [Candidatus Eremiobacteraeota bacterium]MBV9645830.1 hypothetical protein [Candidatus Eremiobacteraeota bacterium]